MQCLRLRQVCLSSLYLLGISSILVNYNFFNNLFLIAKFCTKIKANIDARENQIRKDIEEANSLKEEADKKLKRYNDLIDEAKLEAKKILSEGGKKINEDIQIKRNRSKRIYKKKL